MKNYALMYAVWIAAVLVMAGCALAWYRKVEAIGLRELADKLRATDAPEATEDETHFYNTDSERRHND